MFAASSAPAPTVPQWDLAAVEVGAGYADDAHAPALASDETIDPVPAEVPQWTLSQVDDMADAPSVSGDDTVAFASAGTPDITSAPVFDPVAAEHGAADVAADEVVFRFDADALDNADDVLSLHAMETLVLEDDADLHPVLDSVDAEPTDPVSYTHLRAHET